jgi:hypothetical protein
MFPSATFVTSVREPLSRYISDALYYKWNFNKMTAKAWKRPNYNETLQNCLIPQPVVNKMTSDLIGPGYTFAQLIDDIRSDRLFVVVVEHFAESLVLLAKRLNWSDEELYSYKQHSRKATAENVAWQKRFTPAIRQTVRQVHGLDQRLYDESVNAHMRLRRAYGPSFDDDVAAFKTGQKAKIVECNRVGSVTFAVVNHSVAFSFKHSHFFPFFLSFVLYKVNNRTGLFDVESIAGRDDVTTASELKGHLDARDKALANASTTEDAKVRQYCDVITVRFCAECDVRVVSFVAHSSTSVFCCSLVVARTAAHLSLLSTSYCASLFLSLPLQSHNSGNSSATVSTSTSHAR